MNKFSKFLRKKILKNLRQTELILLIQPKFEVFSGLDAMTLSRWCNGKTSPSLYKQLLISDSVGCLEEYINTLPSVGIPKRMMEYYRKYTMQFDHYYHKLVKYDDDALKVSFYQGFSTQELARSIYSKIGGSRLFGSYHKFFDMKIPMESFYSLHKAEILSFCYYYEISEDVFNVINKYIDLKLVSFDINLIKDSIIVPLAYFYNTEQYEEIFGLLLNRILRLHFKKKTIFFVVRGSESMIFYEKIGAEVIQIIREDKYNLYVCMIDIKLFFSNALIFNIVINATPEYNDYLALYEDN